MYFDFDFFRAQNNNTIRWNVFLVYILGYPI